MDVQFSAQQTRSRPKPVVSVGCQEMSALHSLTLTGTRQRAYQLLHSLAVLVEPGESNHDPKHASIEGQAIDHLRADNIWSLCHD